MKKFAVIVFLTLIASNAIATVCFETPNPCKSSASCEAVSDFVFDAEFQGGNDEEYVDQGEGGGKDTHIASHKKALFKVESWVKGKPLHDPTIINDYVMDESFCVGVKPIGALEQGKKYRIYGYYQGSDNYNKIMNSSEYPGPRMDARYYLKFEELK